VHRLVGSHNFLAAPSLSLVLQSRDLGIYIDSDLGAVTSNVRRTVSRFRRIATASSSTSSRRQRLLSPSRGLVRPLQSIMATFCVCWASCLSSTTSTDRTLNAAACLVFRLHRCDHVSDALAILHWLLTARTGQL